MRERVVIVGAGPAGVAAAVQCRRLGVTPCLFDATGEAGGLVTNAFCVENLPGLPPCEGHVLAARLRDTTDRRLEIDNNTAERAIRPWRRAGRTGCSRGAREVGGPPRCT